MRDALVVSLLSVLPRRRMSRWMGHAARTRVSRWGCRAFIRAYGVDLSEAVVPDGGFDSLDALFTRALRPRTRPIARGSDVFVSPVDGRCVFAGGLRDGRLPVAPGHTVAWSEMVGGSLAERSQVVVLYLSPRDYHRVHAPVDGQITDHHHVPGTLWPVYEGVARHVPDLYARNERVVVRLDTAHGPMTVVLIGAFGVGDVEVRAAHGPVARGDELGVFHLGSTVVVSMPPGSWTWAVKPGDAVRVGCAVARWDGPGPVPH